VSAVLTRPEVAHYAYQVTWSAEDEEFVATCQEFPSLSWLAESQDEALEGLLRMVDEVVQELQEAGEEVPQPFSERKYSGRFNVRVGSELHRRLAQEAERDGLSLNTMVVRKLAG